MTDTKPAKAAPVAVPADEKLCRVLKNGAGKIAKGFTAVEEDGQIREQFYAKGDEFIMASKIADELEDRGFVET